MNPFKSHEFICIVTWWSVGLQYKVIYDIIENALHPGTMTNGKTVVN